MSWSEEEEEEWEEMQQEEDSDYREDSLAEKNDKSCQSPEKKRRRVRARTDLGEKSTCAVDSYLSEDADLSAKDSKGATTHNFEILEEEILKLSKNKTSWEAARKEWYRSHVFRLEGGTCLCTHHPITQHCVINNKHTKAVTIVGSYCITHFINQSMCIEDSFWNALSHLMEKGPSDFSTKNDSLLYMALESQILTRKDWKWYVTKTRRKGSKIRFNKKHRCFESKAFKRREIINKRILYGFHADRPSCLCRPHVPALPCYSKITEEFSYGCGNCQEADNSRGGCGFTASVPELSTPNELDILLASDEEMDALLTNEAT